MKQESKRKKTPHSKVLDCRENGEYVASDDSGKVSLRVKELNCYILAKKELVDTPQKKSEYIGNYITRVNESRKRFADAYTNI